MITCIICTKPEEECLNFCMSKMIICNKCKRCKQCCRQKNNICSVCCIQCKMCNKIIVKNNWPLDIIINDMCDKCSHLCYICNVYLDYNKLYHCHTDTEMKNYCIQCYGTKYKPVDENYKYNMKIKKTMYSNAVIGWKKVKRKGTCSQCVEVCYYDLNLEQTNTLKCMDCYRNVKKKENVNKKSETCKNPNSAEDKYALKDGEWIMISKKKKCIKCLSNVWIKINNLRTDEIYRCSNKFCSPEDDKKKCKYDKDQQCWIPYRIIKECVKCKENKWMFVSNVEELCKKCS